jgi:hypothetical protein
MNISWKIYSGRQSSCPLRIYIKGIVRAFKCLKCLGGFLHLKPTAVCQISTLILENFFVERGSLWISYEKYIPDCKVLVHLGLRSKVLPVLVTDLSAWVGFWTSSPQQGIKYQLWYLDFFCGGGSLQTSHVKYIPDGKVLAHFGLNWKVLFGPLTDLSGWVGFCTSSPPQCVQYQFWYLDFFRGPYKYPMKNGQRTAKFFFTWGLNQRYCPGL